ncbi:hypothetical protein NL676_017996 [Syzygium grande]|nr:hypothetical protein NL676_017996 [Syzygium grande]
MGEGGARATEIRKRRRAGGRGDGRAAGGEVRPAGQVDGRGKGFSGNGGGWGGRPHRDGRGSTGGNFCILELARAGAMVGKGRRMDRLQTTKICDGPRF